MADGGFRECVREKGGFGDGLIDICESEGEEGCEKEGEPLRKVVVPIIPAVEDS